MKAKATTESGYLSEIWIKMPHWWIGKVRLIAVLKSTAQTEGGVQVH